METPRSDAMEEEGMAVCSAIGYNEYDHVQVSVSMKKYPCPHCTKSFSKSKQPNETYS